MTIAILIIIIVTLFYLLSLKFSFNKKRTLHYKIISDNKSFELKRLRRKISKCTGLTKNLIYTNDQIKQIMDANIKTIHDLIRLNIHSDIANKYGYLVIKIITEPFK